MENEMVERVAKALAARRALLNGLERGDPEIAAYAEKHWKHQVGDARAAIEAIGAMQQPIAWRVKRGASNIWGYAETEADADFHGGAGGMRYIKGPLFAALEPQKVPA